MLGTSESIDDPGLFRPVYPEHNIFKRVREELRVELRSCLYSVEEAGRATRSKVVVVGDGAQRHRVSLRVQSPLDVEMEGYLLVFFDEMPDAADGADEESITVRELEAELDVTQKRLQSVIEDHENSQDDMRAANEELQSANEELRSTMEELETSKEELQSMNEELTTVNQENRSKVEELSMMTSDLQNLLASTDIATLFLDRELRIMRFTPQVEDRIEAPEVFPALGCDLQTLLFQVVREILFNTVKHAAVKEARVRLTSGDEHIHIEIEDSGKGFDPAEELSREGSSSGFGLRTVSERIELFGGSVDIESVPGEGTCVRISVPNPSAP